MASLIEATAAVPQSPAKSTPRGMVWLNLLATVHLVWFYLTRTPCELRLVPYEQGLERTPFQYRLLLMLPLRLAHRSSTLRTAAEWLSMQHAWFPRGVRPEGLLQAFIDLAAIATTGLVACRLYRLTSRSGLLSAYVYPLTLLMILSTYSLMTFHAYRFPSDMPEMALFALGLYLIYTEAPAPWFAVVFLVGMVNRETTLLLLVFFVLAHCVRSVPFGWRRALSRQTLATAGPLLAAWIAWHLWVVHHFAANPSAAGPRLALNLGTLLIPLAWPQLFACCCYMLPPIILLRHRVEDPILRVWVWALPVWFAFMLCFGLIVEIRLFGELIAYLACVSALLAEQALLLRLDPRSRYARSATPHSLDSLP